MTPDRFYTFTPSVGHTPGTAGPQPPVLPRFRKAAVPANGPKELAQTGRGV
jgi:hypothetical protein